MNPNFYFKIHILINQVANHIQALQNRIRNHICRIDVPDFLFFQQFLNRIWDISNQDLALNSPFIGINDFNIKEHYHNLLLRVSNHILLN